VTASGPDSGPRGQAETAPRTAAAGAVAVQRGTPQSQGARLARDDAEAFFMRSQVVGILIRLGYGRAAAEATARRAELRRFLEVPDFVGAEREAALRFVALGLAVEDTRASKAREAAARQELAEQAALDDPWDTAWDGSRFDPGAEDVDEDVDENREQDAVDAVDEVDHEVSEVPAQAADEAVDDDVWP